MKNIIYNELLYRRYNVDDDTVEVRNKDNRIQQEVDFFVTNIIKDIIFNQF